MQEMEREAHKFKAREAAVLRAVPFVPQPVRRFRSPENLKFDFITDKTSLACLEFERLYRVVFLTGPSKISIRLHSKSHQCQNLLTGWHLEKSC